MQICACVHACMQHANACMHAPRKCVRIRTYHTYVYIINTIGCVHELYVYLNYTWQWKRLAIWRAQPPYAAPISIALPFLPSKAGTQRSRSVVKALSDALATASGVWIHIFESCVSVRTASVNCTDSTVTTVGVSRFGEGMGERREREKEERKRERERAREIQTQT